MSQSKQTRSGVIDYHKYFSKTSRNLYALVTFSLRGQCSWARIIPRHSSINYLCHNNIFISRVAYTNNRARSEDSIRAIYVLSSIYRPPGAGQVIHMHQHVMISHIHILEFAAILLNIIIIILLNFIYVILSFY